MRGGARMLMVVLATAAVAVPLARASRMARVPLAVQTASLEQSGRYLVWSIETSAPFSPGALAVSHRSVCLVIEPIGGDQGAGQLCLAGPLPGGRTPSLQYRAAGATAGAVVPATVTRAGSHQLTATFLVSAIANAYAPVRWQVASTLGRPHCTSPTRRACVVLWPAKPALASLHQPQPLGCTASGPAFVGGVTTTRPEIALTFDDGPWYQTPQFLSLLEHYGVPATFFEVGEHIAEYGEGGAIERRMLADGDMIGDHTWSHIDVAAGGLAAIEQIDRAALAIREATRGFTPCLFRAPDGNVGPALIGEARSLGFTTIQWDIDPRDWALPGVAAIEDNVLTNAHPGAIVILHDGGGDRSQTLQALPDIIETLRARGYTFATVTQLLGQRVIYR